MTNNYVGEFALDARPDRIDLRDREYLPPLKSLEPNFPSERIVKEFFPTYVDHKMVLNQGSEGACTGFGLAAMINYLFWRRELEKNLEKDSKIFNFTPPAKVSTRMLYHLARFYDEWPGEDYDGSSCRGAVKAWHRHGVCTDTIWPYRNENNRVVFISPRKEWNIDAATRPLGVYYRVNKDAITDMQAAIQEVGAIYVSGHVHDGWNISGALGEMSHNYLPIISWQAGKANSGGHAFALVGYNSKGFIVQNSWGTGWGLRGFAVLSYEDWLVNGTDVWVCVLGVPQQGKVASHYLNKAQSSHDNELARRATGGSVGSDHSYADSAVTSWDTSEAYNHTVVMGNDGRVINRLIANEKAQDTVDDIVFAKPKKFFEDGGPHRIAFYAHGGLNDEESSITRIQTMAPYFKANGIYPIFFTWKTGFTDSLINILEDSTSKIFHRAEGLDDLLNKVKEKAREALDRTLELGSENLGVKAIWSQMKQNASEAAKKGDDDRGAFLATTSLVKLSEIYPNLEIHMVGHSAGSIILGHMLDDFHRYNLKVKTMSLYAPACSIDFANKHYKKSVDKGILEKANLFIHLLSSEREKADKVGPYHKSLLYLVSRALEEYHKTPLMGMVDTYHPEGNETLWSRKTKSHLRKWQEFFSSGSNNLSQISSKQVVTARKWTEDQSTNLQSIPSAHGSFDNDVDVVATTLKRITGKHVLQHRVENLRF